MLVLWFSMINNNNIGIIILKETSKSTVENHCMGVKKKYHHQGIGTALQQKLEEYAEKRYKFLQVKTVDEGHYKEYDATIRFYQKVGFKKFEVFPTLWDEWNPCLVIDRKSTRLNSSHVAISYAVFCLKK